LAKEAARIAARELAEERRLASRPVERGGRPLVLIVDHSRTVQRILVEHLEPEYAVICAFSGQEALSLAVREKPNLVILDVVLPDMDGDDVVSQLRQCPDMEDAPILVLTSSRDEDKLLELLAGSVQDVVKKPFMTVAVGARVRNLLAERRTRELLNATIGRHETDLVVLAERVVGQQEALKIAREAADAANRAKSDFLRMMSHELRTPITAMELQMKLIELDRDSVPEKVHVGLRRIARSSRRLNRIIDTVMAWARVESGRLELDVSPLRAADLVERAATDLRELAELKGIGITTRVEEDVTIESDRGMAYLLVANLLAHAVQVTSHGTVCATVGGRPAATRIVVRDDGPRLPDGAEADILRPFEAVEPLHRRSGFGSGLDLHVVWDIARALSGDVSLMRDEERGNAFVLTLPSLRKAGTAV
jgi:signal transduction histidine kinase